MQPRPDCKAARAASDALHAIRTLEKAVENCGLEQSLIALVKTRVSQINGCACGIRLHASQARAHGETEERLYLLHAWRDAAAPYTCRERAALAWSEALTLVAGTHATDGVYQQVREQFSDEELAKLTLLVGTANLWDRLAIGFRPAARATARTSEALPGGAATVAVSRRSGARAKSAGLEGLCEDGVPHDADQLFQVAEGD